MRSLLGALLLCSSAIGQLWQGGQGCDGVFITPQGQPKCIQCSGMVCRNNMVFHTVAPAAFSGQPALHIEGTLTQVQLNAFPLCWLYVNPIIIIPGVITPQGSFFTFSVARRWLCSLVGVQAYVQGIVLAPDNSWRSSGWIKYQVFQ